MPIVLDANLVVALASGDPRKAVAEALIRRWIETGEVLHAPTLLFYEVANGLTRSVAAGALAITRVDEAWRTVIGSPLVYHRLHDGAAVTSIALRLQRQSAYDAASIALAEQLGAQLWTFDGPLYRNASGLGFPVHLAG